MKYFLNNDNTFFMNKENDTIYIPNIFFNENIKDKKIKEITSNSDKKLIDKFFNNIDAYNLWKLFVKAHKDSFVANFSETEDENILNRINGLESEFGGKIEKIEKEIIIVNSSIGNFQIGLELIDKINIIDIKDIEEKTKIIKELIHSLEDFKKTTSQKSLINSCIAKIKQIQNELTEQRYLEIINEEKIKIITTLFLSETISKLFEQYIGNKIISKENIKIGFEKGAKKKVLKIDTFFSFSDKQYIIDFKFKHYTDDNDLYKQIVYSAFLKEHKDIDITDIYGVMIKPKACSKIEVERAYNFLDLKIFIINYPTERILNNNYQGGQKEIVDIIDQYIKNNEKDIKQFSLEVEN